MRPDVYYKIVMRDGKVHEGFLGREIKKIVRVLDNGRVSQKGYEVLTKFGVWIEVWDTDIAQEGGVRMRRGEPMKS